MCGIVGYTGFREAEPILIDGLARLEYRGYDSAGLATLAGSKLFVRKAAGRIANLAEVLTLQPAPGTCGISHTRWATHGPATDTNAHPHLGGNGEVAVVHNGVIENHAALKKQLEADGFRFKSQTDTEVIAHLIAQNLDGDLVEAVRAALAQLKGTYGLAVVSPRFPGLIVGARLGSPLVVGIGANEHFLASDPSALVGYTERVIYLEDRQLGVLRPQRWDILAADRRPASVQVQALDWETDDADKGDFEHYMLKEIYEQPEALERALAGRLDEATIDGALYTAGMPEPDLLIRTAGEMRVSNFLLWQISYAELWVTDKCWPEFDEAVLQEALKDYAQRERRFGGLS
jgi:glucosamine--fructose-6-phosphate aminotransferase (isomerizing)